MTASARARALLAVAASAADAKQGEDIVALDVSGPLPLTDIFLLVTGRNERHVQGIAGEIEDKMIEAGVKTIRREGRSEGRQHRQEEEVTRRMKLRAQALSQGWRR